MDYKYTMCDFRRKLSNREVMRPAKILSVVQKEGQERKDLKFVVGEVSLDRTPTINSYNYSIQVTVSGIHPDDDTVAVCTLAEFPTTFCPNCGRKLN